MNGYIKIRKKDDSTFHIEEVCRLDSKELHTVMNMINIHRKTELMDLLDTEISKETLDECLGMNSNKAPELTEETYRSIVLDFPDQKSYLKLPEIRIILSITDTGNLNKHYYNIFEITSSGNGRNVSYRGPADLMEKAFALMNGIKRTVLP